MGKLNNISVTFVIIIFGLLIIFTSIIKYTFLGGEVSAPFYVSEYITYALILSLIYYLNFQIIKRNKIIKKQEDLILLQKDEFGKRESELLLKIMNLEEKEREEFQFTINKEKTLTKIFKKIDKEQPANEILNRFLIALSKNIEIIMGIGYLYDKKNNQYSPVARYAIDDEIEIPAFIKGEGFVGQAASDNRIMVINDIPEDYLSSSSGLGEHIPKQLYFLPIKRDQEVIGIIELGTFKIIEINRIWEDINNKLIDLL